MTEYIWGAWPGNVVENEMEERGGGDVRVWLSEGYIEGE